MSKDRSAVTLVALDKSYIEWLLMMTTAPERPTCGGCGKQITRNSFGGALNLKSGLTLFHDSFLCWATYTKKSEAEPDLEEYTKKKIDKNAAWELAQKVSDGLDDTQTEQE